MKRTRPISRLFCLSLMMIFVFGIVALEVSKQFDPSIPKQEEGVVVTQKTEVKKEQKRYDAVLPNSLSSEEKTGRARDPGAKKAN